MGSFIFILVVGDGVVEIFFREFKLFKIVVRELRLFLFWIDLIVKFFVFLFIFLMILCLLWVDCWERFLSSLVELFDSFLVSFFVVEFLI